MTWTTTDALAMAVAAQSQPALAARHLAAAGFPRGDWTLDAALDAAGLAEADRVAARQGAAGWQQHAATQGYTVLASGCVGYPAALETLPDPPLALWVRGDPAVVGAPAVALVGSRAARPGALEVAHALATDLARCGLVVISGLALGVDGAAHRGALLTGTTAAVLGTGLDVVYPRRHAELADRIGALGALVTEFLPGSPPRAHHFPLRNRILSGLSMGVVVVEASERSGSLITARLALEQGRAVMVIPGDVRGGANRGGHALLRDGARLVESAADVLEELGLAPTPAIPDPWHTCEPPAEQAMGTASVGASDARPAPAGLPRLLQIILAAGGPTLDELSARLAQPPAVLLAELLDFELAGLVTRDLSGRFLPVQRKW